MTAVGVRAQAPVMYGCKRSDRSFHLSSLYYCHNCQDLRNPLQVCEEIDSFFCPGCLENMASVEASRYKHRYPPPLLGRPPSVILLLGAVSGCIGSVDNCGRVVDGTTGGGTLCDVDVPQGNLVLFPLCSKCPRSCFESPRSGNCRWYR